ncbi:MAG: heavy metal translocating P-type ATPase metal-binding domain-containing protein [Myxococcales bacterium]|nr:MAG: heavy metal translocating P-type ATPase metal-binding domain-containing protein [Myxococcales bacterium]
MWLADDGHKIVQSQQHDMNQSVVFKAEASNKEATVCKHCALPLGPGSVGEFCCRGCQVVFSLLHEEKLGRYYSLRRGRGIPVADTNSKAVDLKWLEQLEKQKVSEGIQHVRLDVQGLHCTGCVWLFETLFRRQQGAYRIITNPSLGSVDLSVDEHFPLREWVSQLQSFGYRFGPRSKKREKQSDSLLIRMGICLALAGNAMLFAIATYLGLHEGELYRFVNTVNFFLSVIAVIVGGSVFFRSAWTAIQKRVLHFDVPIALGIGLAFCGSLLAFVRGVQQVAYHDTLTIFIALMLLGRFLQERALERNRRHLLAMDGSDGILVRRREGKQVNLCSL